MCVFNLREHVSVERGGTGVRIIQGVCLTSGNRGCVFNLMEQGFRVIESVCLT